MKKFFSSAMERCRESNKNPGDSALKPIDASGSGADGDRETG